MLDMGSVRVLNDPPARCKNPSELGATRSLMGVDSWLDVQPTETGLRQVHRK
jgi:hypothetical protein